MNDYREDKELMSVLESGSNEDLAILIDIITDNGAGRISLDSDIKDGLIIAKNTSTLIDIITDNGARRISLDSDIKEGLIIAKNTSTIDLATKHIIATEIQKFGGNSLINIFRGGKGVLYRESACDVADHIGANYNDKQDIEQIEAAILLKIVEKSLERMSEEEKKQFFDQFGVKYKGVGPAAMAAMIAAIKVSGFAFYKMAAIVAQATAKALLGKGLTFATTGTMMRGISVFAGPIGWAITGIWTAFDLASPAYRVTVPCVIQIAYMRQQAMISECPACKALVTKDTKFCGECGHKLA